MSEWQSADPAGGCGLMLISSAIAGAFIAAVLIVVIVPLDTLYLLVKLIATVAATLAIIFATGAALDGLVAFVKWVRIKREQRRWDRTYRDRLNMDVRKGRGGDHK